MVRRTLHDGTLDSLGQQIVSGRYHPGQILRTEDLELEHDVSRTVLRETLKVLESMGLISMRRRVGITVLARTHWSVYDPQIIRWRMASDDRAAQLNSLTDLRFAVEPIAAHHAAISASPQQREEIVMLASQMFESGIPRDTELHLKQDLAFHTLLLQASGNEMFMALRGVIAAVITGRIEHRLVPPDPTRESLDLHIRVARAVHAERPLAAERAMRQLLTEVKGALPRVPSPAPSTHRRATTDRS